MPLFLRLLLALTLFAETASAWGCAGHQMIALIARAHLNPAASAAVDRLLAAYPLDPAQKRFCQSRPADPMADAASWADDMKSLDKTFTWHFVDIPLAVSGTARPALDLTPWCEPVGPSVEGKDRPGCIVSAIAYEWGILRDHARPGPERAKALRYLIHFLGDLTQPLHDADNHDQGGNCTRLSFFENEKPENLHAIWDDRMLSRAMRAASSTEASYAAGLDREFAHKWRAWGRGKKVKMPRDIAAWAWEGHRVASRVTYGDLMPPIPVAPPSAGLANREACDAGREAVASLHIAIADQYFNEAMPVVREQLAKAAYRLAALLNQGF